MENWTDRNGNITQINKLETSHLQNIIRMIWRQNRDLQKALHDEDIDCDISSRGSCILYLNYILSTFKFKKDKNKKYSFELKGDMAQQFNEMFPKDEDEIYDPDFWGDHPDDMPIWIR